MHAKTLLLLALAASAAPVPAASAAERSGPGTYTFGTGEAPRVKVSTVNGQVRVEGTDGREVRVDARLEGSNREDWDLEVTHAGDEVEVRVCCGPCAQAKQNRCEGEAPRADLALRVPKGARLHVSSVNASVQVRDVAGRQQLSTVNGRVELRGSSQDVDVSTVNGRVELAPAAVGATSVSTVDGDVQLRLPREGGGARVTFSSVSGSFNGRSEALGNRSETYGDGAHRVRVSTVSGGLEVREGR
jgi:DUF4097 and DUF4098 domain-containing protein YvlB